MMLRATPNLVLNSKRRRIATLKNAATTVTAPGSMSMRSVGTMFVSVVMNAVTIVIAPGYRIAVATFAPVTTNAAMTAIA
jgi:hypothetical protein